MPTGFLWDERFAWHDAGMYPFPQMEPMPVLYNANAKRRIRNLIDTSGLLAKLASVPFGEADDAAILRAHSPEYLARLRAFDETGGNVAPFCHIAAGGLSILRLAAGAAMSAVDAVMNGSLDNAYALVRPAGHHAERDSAMGFCFLNNVAIAALHAIKTHGLGRVAIVDWDVHHGNGAQSIFWNDPRILTVSLHQEDLFVSLSTGECGGVEWRGDGDGAGTNINVPLPPGSGEGAYLSAFERVVLPALARFKPELIIVASGLDASSHDGLGRMILHSDSYRQLTRMMMESATAMTGGRLVLCHEGGYAPNVMPFLGLAILETLSGIRTDVKDPFVDSVRKYRGQALQPHQADAIARAASAAGLT